MIKDYIEFSFALDIIFAQDKIEVPEYKILRGEKVSPI